VAKIFKRIIKFLKPSYLVYSQYRCKEPSICRCKTTPTLKVVGVKNSLLVGVRPFPHLKGVGVNNPLLGRCKTPPTPKGVSVKNQFRQ